MLRAAVRGTAVVATLGMALLAAPALADTPAAWDDPPTATGLDYLLVLVLIPVGIAAVITLLVLLPSIIKGDSYQPGQPWRGDDEWFGGPDKGIEAQVDADPGQRGGSGAGF